MLAKLSDYEELRFSSPDGLSLYCRRYGEPRNRQVLLCLPGLTRNCKDFESPSRRLASSWQVLTPDYRGRGQSDWDPKPRRYILARYVEDAWRLLDQLEIDPVVIIGTSLGGLVGLTMAEQHPERVQGLVLNDIGPEIPPAAATRIARYVRQKRPVLSWADAIHNERMQYSESFPDASDAFWEEFTRLSWHENADGIPVPEMDPAVITALKRKYLRDRILQGMLRLVSRPAKALPFDAWAAFRACRAPMLLIRGAVSDVTGTQLVREMLRARPDLRVVDVPNRGHAPTLDEAKAVRALDNFLESVLRG